MDSVHALLLIKLYPYILKDTTVSRWHVILITVLWIYYETIFDLFHSLSPINVFLPYALINLSNYFIWLYNAKETTYIFPFQRYVYLCNFIIYTNTISSSKCELFDMHFNGLNSRIININYIHRVHTSNKPDNVNNLSFTCLSLRQ